MSDPLDLASVASHGVTTVAGAGGVGVVMRWLIGREAAASAEKSAEAARLMATRLVIVEERLSQVLGALAKHDNIGDRLTKLEATCAARHCVPGRKR